MLPGRLTVIKSTFVKNSQLSFFFLLVFTLRCFDFSRLFFFVLLDLSQLYRVDSLAMLLQLPQIVGFEAPLLLGSLVTQVLSNE